ncbi:hypothetical protein [Nocardia farcinica]|uniref:hypothetical protein n=1 Tax=Nocardia farcinica TaxID=37329 RepID=UPI002457E4A2|nr:hypothetical protein [Nocardia farcinica]
MTLPMDGAWLVFPQAGEREGEGGDAYEVMNFGDQELAALREANRREGFKAVYVLPGQTILEALGRQT